MGWFLFCLTTKFLPFILVQNEMEHMVIKVEQGTNLTRFLTSHSFSCIYNNGVEKANVTFLTKESIKFGPIVPEIIVYEANIK